MTVVGRRAFIGLLGGASILALAGCTSFRPVYGGKEMGLAFNIAEPKTPVERIAYREFMLRFESSHASDVPRLEYVVLVSNLPGQMAKTWSSPAAPPRQATIRSTIRAKVIWQGESVFEVERFADAGFQTGRSPMADTFSSQEAAERATKAAAESVRLALLAEYPLHEQMWSRGTK